MKKQNRNARLIDAQMDAAMEGVVSATETTGLLSAMPADPGAAEALSGIAPMHARMPVVGDQKSGKR